MTTLAATYHPSETEPYMNQQQQHWFRQLLTQQKFDLVQRCTEADRQIRRAAEPQTELIDRSVLETERGRWIREAVTLRKRLSQIDAALQRIHDGDYGYCLMTGEEIGVRRLMAQPTAIFSVEAQDLLEKKKVR